VTGDLRYCRAVLPRVSRTFAINIRLLGGPLRDWVSVAYLLCRAADTLEDSWPGAGLGDRFDRFAAALVGDERAGRHLAEEAAAASQRNGAADVELVAHLPQVLRAHREIPASARVAVCDCVSTLSAGMRRYAVRATARGRDVPYLDDESELDDYCWLVAGCVGVMLTRLYAEAYRVTDSGAQARRLELAPIVGQALQLTNILLDWPSDIRRGRCYLPHTWLAERHLRPADLVDREHPESRLLARRLEAKALAALARVPDYVDAVPARHLRYRLFCSWPALWALGSVRQARRDPEFPWGPRRPKLPRSELWRTSLASLLTADQGAQLRRLCAATAR
jgi:farnesyl-diphosphate farnesyltransferase